MANIPEDRKYSKDHEWLLAMGGNRARVGLTDHAQKQLGDIVFVEQPNSGDRFGHGEPFGSVESVKSVSEVYMPEAGQVIARNDQLADSPELINDDPYGDGWLIAISLDTTSPDGLLSAEEYGAYIIEEASE